MPEQFGDRLAAAITRQGRLCLGIDPHRESLQQWGLPDNVTSMERFARALIEAGAGSVPVIKPQVALFERFGSAGYSVLERVLEDARQAGLLILADAKRGDIGSTMAGYAEAWFSEGSPLRVDALTLSPYLGFGSLHPVLDLAARYGGGVFVLALTSNPEGAQVQHARIAEGTEGEPETMVPVARSIVRAAAAANSAVIGGAGIGGAAVIGPVGLVVGATTGSAAEDLGLRLDTFNGPILAPGFGAQGAGVAELRQVFGAAYSQVLVPASRAIAAAGPDPRALDEKIRLTVAELN